MRKTEKWSAKTISTFKNTIERSANVYFTAKSTKDSCFYGKLSNGLDISNSLVKLDLAIRECFNRLFIERFVNINIWLIILGTDGNEVSEINGNGRSEKGNANLKSEFEKFENVDDYRKKMNWKFPNISELLQLTLTKRQQRIVVLLKRSSITFDQMVGRSFYFKNLSQSKMIIHLSFDCSSWSIFEKRIHRFNFVNVSNKKCIYFKIYRTNQIPNRLMWMVSSNLFLRHNIPKALKLPRYRWKMKKPRNLMVKCLVFNNLLGLTDFF